MGGFVNRMSNYPPGVTGNEPEISGEDEAYEDEPFENELVRRANAPDSEFIDADDFLAELEAGSEPFVQCTADMDFACIPDANGFCYRCNKNEKGERLDVT